MPVYLSDPFRACSTNLFATDGSLHVSHSEFFHSLRRSKFCLQYGLDQMAEACAPLPFMLIIQAMLFLSPWFLRFHVNLFTSLYMLKKCCRYSTQNLWHVHQLDSLGASGLGFNHQQGLGLSENSVPLNPMVLLIIIPIKWLFHWEYTQHFQTNPFLFHPEKTFPSRRKLPWHCLAMDPLFFL